MSTEAERARCELLAAAQEMLSPLPIFDMGGRPTHVRRAFGGYVAVWADTGVSIDNVIHVDGHHTSGRESAAHVAKMAAMPTYYEPEWLEDEE